MTSGELQLPLNSVDLAAPIEEWKDLAPVDDGSNQYLGDLCLSLRYVPSSGKLTGEQENIAINPSMIKVPLQLIHIGLRHNAPNFPIIKSFECLELLKFSELEIQF